MEEQYAIEVKDLTISYRNLKKTSIKKNLFSFKRQKPENFVAVNNISFYVREGEILGIIGKNGCGITAFAMLATYMTDSIQTPHMVAQQFSKFQVGTSTDGSIFSKAPAELGFYADRTVFDIDQVIEALRSGQVVISLQVKGIFTSSGHYLLVQAYNEEDDTFEVRDSNIYNYGKLSGHKVDYFTRENILSGGAIFYIMEKKITTIPACARCGDGSAPERLMNQEYLCPKCAAALSRRNTFLELMG